MSEKNLWTSCRKKWPDIFLQRIETAVERGIPDLFYCYQGITGWLEGKYLDKPVHETSKCRTKVSVEQIAWHRSFRRNKGAVFLLVKVSKEVFLFDSGEAETLNSGVVYKNLKDLSLAHGWDKIRDFLINKENYCINDN